MFGYRTEFRWLMSRAFCQGYSNRAIESMVGDESGKDESFSDTS